MPNMMERLAEVDRSKTTAKDHALSAAVPLITGVAGATLGAKWKHSALKKEVRARPLKTEEQLMELGDSIRMRALGGVGLVGGAMAVHPFLPQKEKPDLAKTAYELSEAMERYAENKENDGSVAVELGAAGAGGVGLANAKDMITGRKTLYHGTSADNAQSIKAQGFKPSDGKSGASGLAGMQEYVDQSKGKTHFSTAKPVANFFAKYLGEGQYDNAYIATGRGEAGLSLAGEDPTARAQAQKRMDDLVAEADRLKGLRKGEVLKVNVPYDAYARMEADPHIIGEQALPDALGGKLLASTTTESIPSRYIKGAPDALNFKQQMAESAQHFPSYIKNHPGRFGSGVAMLGGGAAGLGYAGKGLYDRLSAQEPV